MQTALARLEQDAAAWLVKYRELPAKDLLRRFLVDEMPGKIAMVSSFGTESAVLLHMIAEIDKSTPIIFINTLKLFGETLRYRDQLV
jgi:phosphoadenosine phosphosulfate reductase